MPTRFRLLSAVPLLAALALLAACGPPAARADTESLINKLPDPNSLERSPLESAIVSQDPEFLRLKRGLQNHTVTPDAALRSLRTLTAKYPGNAAFHLYHSNLAVRLKKYPEAEAECRALTTIKGAEAAGWALLGGVQADQRKPEAAGSLRQAVKIQPKLAIAWLALAVVEGRQSHFNEGADAARHFTQLQAKAAPGWGLLAFCEAGQKKYDAAIADYQRALALNRRYAFGYEGLGLCYAATNRTADAVAPLKNALALQPRDYLAATELGYCYLRSGQPADGIRVCRQAVAVKPGFGKAWDVMGLCYKQQGKKREAADAFRRAVKAMPNDANARAHLASVA